MDPIDDMWARLNDLLDQVDAALARDPGWPTARATGLARVEQMVAAARAVGHGDMVIGAYLMTLAPKVFPALDPTMAQLVVLGICRRVM